MVIFLQAGQIHGTAWKKKKIRKERRSLLINYVTFPTDWKVKS